VINALADDAAAKTQGKGFVPYRNSKLTRVLQQSLGAAHCRAFQGYAGQARLAASVSCFHLSGLLVRDSIITHRRPTRRRRS
jgi:hypothetical protein